MKIYNYEKLTGIFTNATDARESPLETGVYLIPALATTIEPPKVPEGSVAVFADGAWQIIEDNRGIWYDGKIQVFVNTLGPVPEQYTKEPPPLSQEEIDTIALLQARIVALEKAREESGVHKYTPEQVKEYIDNQFAAATTVAQIKTVVADILKKIAVYTLR